MYARGRKQKWLPILGIKRRAPYRRFTVMPQRRNSRSRKLFGSCCPKPSNIQISNGNLSYRGEEALAIGMDAESCYTVNRSGKVNGRQKFLGSGFHGHRVKLPLRAVTRGVLGNTVELTAVLREPVYREFARSQIAPGFAIRRDQIDAVRGRIRDPVSLRRPSGHRAFPTTGRPVRRSVRIIIGAIPGVARIFTRSWCPATSRK